MISAALPRTDHRLAGPSIRALAAGGGRSAREHGMRRTGVATMELVLCVPILLFVMALMVGFGAAATWKLRAQGEARGAAWRHFWPRWGEMNGFRPPEWQPPQTIGFNGGGALPALASPAYDAPVMHGPLGKFVVNQNLLNPQLSLDEGVSRVERPFPLLGKVLPKFQFLEQNYVFDRQWQFGQMGMGNNFSHRMDVLYQMPQPSAGLLNQYTAAAQAAASLHHADPLTIFDHDEELKAHFGTRPNGDSYYIDLYPRLPGFSSLDTNYVESRIVKRHLQRIEGRVLRNGRRVGSFPQSVASVFLRMYQQQQAALAPNFSPQIQTKIDQLQAYLAKLARG